MEAGITKVADGVDMAEGRARMPYRQGKYDIHALSALAIRRVEVTRGEPKKTPIRIIVDMDNEAGIFQVEEVLGKKIKTSSIAHLVEVEALRRGEPFRVLKF
jgi:metal-dependent HD superfamily phosphatase/phosphodiesterase